MNRAIQHHGSRPIIDRVFEFDDVAEAFSHFEHGSRVGRIVIRHPR
jgi:NADPH:quinone reductase-like Zn-dependent oxidoreductase